MKRAVILAWGVAILVFGIAAGATAGGKAKGKGKSAASKPLKGAMWKKVLTYDRDHDTILSEDEWTMARRDMERDPVTLAEFDANHDKTLDDQEWAAAETAFKARIKAFMKPFDTNYDGKLSPEERRTADAAQEYADKQAAEKAKKQAGSEKKKH